MLKVRKTERGVGVGAERDGRREGREEGMKERKGEEGRSDLMFEKGRSKLSPIIIYRENPEEPTTLLEIIRKFSKVAKYKMDRQQ